MKKLLIVILVWFIVAGLFYAAIWTHEKNTLSDCFLYTGFVAVAQIILTCISYPITQELCRMKKIILLALTTLMMVGCEYKNDTEIEEAKRLNGFNIVVIDSCEYLEKSDATGYQGYGYFAHKGNCRFCKERRQKELKKLVLEIK